VVIAAQVPKWICATSVAETVAFPKFAPDPCSWRIADKPE